ncbi:hypothetical protein [Streptomyces sp. NPDC127084]|uniref:hypothetical protein n=1 Tax=Streptomyces sp. NPDC127084 TaxID=3347133 RepID=UPI003661BE31
MIRETHVDGLGVWQVTHEGSVLETLPDWVGNLALWIAADNAFALLTADRDHCEQRALDAETLVRLAVDARAL